MSATYGYLVEFETPLAVMQAAEAVRDEGFTKWDTFTPYPVHGLDGAMGIQRTHLPWVVLCAGLTGTTVAFLMQYWMNAIDYPFVVSGKPFMSLPAFVPIMFEMTVLFAALSALGGMLAFNGLPRLSHPLFASERFARATDDRFFICIEADDPKVDGLDIQAFLAGLGGSAIETIDDEEA